MRKLLLFTLFAFLFSCKAKPVIVYVKDNVSNDTSYVSDFNFEKDVYINNIMSTEKGNRKAEENPIASFYSVGYPSLYFSAYVFNGDKENANLYCGEKSGQQVLFQRDNISPLHRVSPQTIARIKKVLFGK